MMATASRSHACRRASQLRTQLPIVGPAIVAAVDVDDDQIICRYADVRPWRSLPPCLDLLGVSSGSIATIGDHRHLTAGRTWKHGIS
jgi:hypothetical protein